VGAGRGSRRGSCARSSRERGQFLVAERQGSVHRKQRRQASGGATPRRVGMRGAAGEAAPRTEGEQQREGEGCDGGGVPGAERRRRGRAGEGARAAGRAAACTREIASAARRKWSQQAPAGQEPAPLPIRSARRFSSRTKGDGEATPDRFRLPQTHNTDALTHSCACDWLIPPLLLLSLIAAAPRRNGASASPRVASVASPSSRPPSCLPRAECSRECQ